MLGFIVSGAAVVVDDDVLDEDVVVVDANVVVDVVRC